MDSQKSLKHVKKTEGNMDSQKTTSSGSSTFRVTMTPSKDLQGTMSVTPSGSPRIAPSPSKRQRLSVIEYMTQFELYHKDFETKCKAAMYDLNTNNKTAATQTMKEMMLQSHNFYSSSVAVFDQLKLRHAALEQKTASLESYNLNLHRENIEMRRKLEQFRGLESCFDEDFGETELDVVTQKQTGTDAVIDAATEIDAKQMEMDANKQTEVEVKIDANTQEQTVTEAKQTVNTKK
jgi:hypothetical protein